MKTMCKQIRNLLRSVEKCAILKPSERHETEMKTISAAFEDLTKKTKDLAYVAADKAKDVAAVAADKAKDAAELTRISMAIAGEQREIDKNYRTIGEWFVSEYEGEIPDAVRDLVEAVNTSKAKIAELEASKPRKDDGAEVEAAAPAQKICPICGAASDSKFCPQCGAPMGEE